VNFTLDDWLPWYNKILETFGYDQSEDQRVTDLLSKLLAGRAEHLAELRKLIANRPVLVFGAGPSLEEDLRQAMKEGVLQKTVTVVADGATTAFVQISGTAPNVIVTDLDFIFIVIF
jgi:hypothetical protein